MTNYVLNAIGGYDPDFNPTGVRFTMTGINTVRGVYGAVASDKAVVQDPSFPGIPVAAWGISVNGGGVGAHDAITPSYGVTVLEALGIHLADLPSLKYSLNLTDQVLAGAVAKVGFPVTLHEGVGVHDAMSIIRGVVLAETLGIGSVLVVNAHYGLAVHEQINLLDGLFRFLSATVSEHVGFHDGFIPTWAYAGVVNEHLGLHEAPTPKLIFGMELDETLEISHAEVLKMIFDGRLAEDVLIRSLYVAPNGTYTTWAMNTRTGAVTEYQNYVFNSFGKIGEHYVGASDQSENPGIFVLDGERDLTANIIADIKGGRMSPGGSRFSTFRSAYLGLRTSNDAADFILKMEAADGREYIYKVKPAPDGVTTKVNMGRGLRSRYFSYELITGGEDFDLDTIEFLPIISKRRVD